MEIAERITPAYACAQDFVKFIQRDLVREDGGVRGEHGASCRVIEMVVRQRETIIRALARRLQRGAELFRQGDVLLRIEDYPALGRRERARVRIAALTDERVNALAEGYEPRTRIIRHQ